jgi:energy-coupling factor transporter ATP-binding protein EcfA2
MREAVVDLQENSQGPIVVVSDLNKIYDSSFHALKSINLEIRPGEMFALLGPNGAGKTTLIGAVAGLVRPTSGVVTVDGCDTQISFAGSPPAASISTASTRTAPPWRGRRGICSKSYASVMARWSSSPVSTSTLFGALRERAPHNAVANAALPVRFRCRRRRLRASVRGRRAAATPCCQRKRQAYLKTRDRT